MTGNCEGEFRGLPNGREHQIGRAIIVADSLLGTRCVTMGPRDGEIEEGRLPARPCR